MKAINRTIQSVRNNYALFGRVFAALSMVVVLILSSAQVVAAYGIASRQPEGLTSIRGLNTRLTATSNNTTSTTSGVITPKATASISSAIKPVISAQTTALACTPDKSYTGPTQLDLTTAATGVTQQVDATHYYQIYGYAADQIRQQIIACAPRLSDDGDFTGYTTYSMSWQYNYATQADGTCKVVLPKIGIHISEVLPTWQPSATAGTGLNTSMATFLKALDIHEHGHIAIDQEYAAQLVSNLESMLSVSCDNIVTNANAVIAAGAATVNQANDNYDASTNHGATQGAVLPE